MHETQSLSAAFTFSGYHDATTKNCNVYQVNTNMVDQKPLAGGLVEFIAADSAGMQFWGNDADFLRKGPALRLALGKDHQAGAVDTSWEVKI